LANQPAGKWRTLVPSAIRFSLIQRFVTPVEFAVAQVVFALRGKLNSNPVTFVKLVVIMFADAVNGVVVNSSAAELVEIP
jgi:hypothetical protein